MSRIILDISANTHKNDETYYKRMIDELSVVDTGKHGVVLKWQLWTGDMGNNIRADMMLFYDMAMWAYEEHGYKTTSSVFDMHSLGFLLGCSTCFDYDLPFIKIANRRDLDWLIGEIPRKYEVYKSVDSREDYYDGFHVTDVETLWCVSEYPANINDYPPVRYISDHTIGLELYHRNQPVVWEKHYKLSDSTGLDAGPFAITPEELRSIL